MRIAHVVPYVAPPYGGPAVVAIETCRALAERGHDVVLVSALSNYPSGRLAPELVSNLEVNEAFRVDLAPLQFRPFVFSVPMARSCLSAVARADVVHVHGMYRFPQLASELACLLSGTPYIVRTHGTLDPVLRANPARARRRRTYERLVEFPLLRRATRLHFTSEVEREQVEQLGFVQPSFVLRNGVSLPAQSSVRPPWTGRRCHVLFLGRLHFKKGLDLLIEGFALARDRATVDLRLTIAGPDHDRLRPGLERLAQQWNVGDHVRFRGMSEGHEKESLFRSADVFALTSRGENFGLAVAEAMSYGVPVLVTERVDIASIVSAGGAGAVCGMAPEAIGSALAELVDSPGRWTTLARNARETARSQLAWGPVAAKLEQEYMSVAR